MDNKDGWDLPNKESENHNASKQVVYEKEDGVCLRYILIRLLALPNDTDCDGHDIDPPFQRHNLE